MNIGNTRERKFFKKLSFFYKKFLTTGNCCAIIDSQRKKKGIKKMKKYNLWKSIYTDEIYEMPVDWLPKFGGWELIGTIEK